MLKIKSQKIEINMISADHLWVTSLQVIFAFTFLKNIIPIDIYFPFIKNH